jgi:Xaa-Pro aminopeptidase
MKSRLSRARGFLKGLDAIVLYSRANVSYISGYTGGDAILVYTDSHACLFVDSRNTLQAKQESSTEVFEITKRWEEIYEHLDGLGVKTLGIESNVIDVDSFIQIKDLFKGIEITPLGKQLVYLRAIKDSDEIALLKKAAALSEESLSRVLMGGIIGRRERDVAFDLECEMKRLGANAESFELIVASGERSAMPHGAASERIIQTGEPVVIDFGSVVEGYCSDQTVTIHTGKPGDEFAEVYAHVAKAQKLAVEALASGVKASYIDKCARGYLGTWGLGKFFGHGLGHGVGMEVHEMPTLSPRSDDILEEAMVVTVEPGVYLPGKYGIRLEDMFMITDTSCQRITNIAKEAIQVIN